MSTHWGKTSKNTITEGIFATPTTNRKTENPQTNPAVIVVEFTSQNRVLHMGKKCNNCQKLGHFAELCRSQAKNPKKSDHNVDYESDSWTHGIDMVKTAVTSDNDEEHASLKINNTTIRIKLDSGAETNVPTKKDFEAAVPKRQRRSKLKTSAAKLTAFGGHNIPVIGKCYHGQK
ncbi:Transposon Tf2-6 poly [Paramuricea clavata]|uniref:Transposon Tf2-6 poly n=1 Tax=Paramuricea clavata TaxID=317549 RepID=A0A6S7IS42_PARCT|nr:Transposon Tf2-6 poly [Paramuricea clavata]